MVISLHKANNQKNIERIESGHYILIADSTNHVLRVIKIDNGIKKRWSDLLLEYGEDIQNIRST